MGVASIVHNYLPLKNSITATSYENIDEGATSRALEAGIM